MLAKTFFPAALLIVVSAGAQTPTPQRTIRENRVTQGKGNDSNAERPAAPDRTIDSLLNSTEDLNSIRDAYLRRIAGDGCRPDVAARVAELRARLNENASHHDQAQTAAAIETRSEVADSLMIVAAGWYQPHPDSAPARTNPEHDRAQLIELVLSAKDSHAPALPGADAAQSKAELDRLLATCRGASR